MSKPSRRDKTRQKPPCIHITDYIARLEAGGERRSSRRVLELIAAGDVIGAQMQAELEAAAGAQAARRHAKYLKRTREGNNKYFPSGGLRP